MNEDKKTNTGGLDTAPDFENFEKADVSEELLEEARERDRESEDKHFAGNGTMEHVHVP